MSAVAFFDLDYTLLDASSGIIYIRESLRQNRLPLWVVTWIGAQYQLKLIDYGEAHARIIKYTGRAGYHLTKEFFNEWVARRLFLRLSPKGLEKIAWHQQQGHQVVIISASIEEIVKPVAEFLGLGSDYLCTRLSVENGHYTGTLDGPLCYGTGKVILARKWAKDNGLEFPECVKYFYTDSSSDMPLLELAKHPVAVNPSRKLARIAKNRNWPIEKFY
jgi:HAD superfamily hydrolase (TIGR01490 family)